MQARRKAAAGQARDAGVGRSRATDTTGRQTSRATTTTGTKPIRSSVSRFGSAATRAPRAIGSATGLDDTLPLAHVRHPVAQHAGEVLAGLGDRGHTARLLDPPRARVVGGDRQ